MFVSNHPSISLPTSTNSENSENSENCNSGDVSVSGGVGGCQPTSSLYIGKAGGVFDVICAYSNYHVEHHDFPDISMWKLGK